MPVHEQPGLELAPTSYQPPWQDYSNAPEVAPTYSSLEVHSQHAWLPEVASANLQPPVYDSDHKDEKEVAQTPIEGSPPPNRRKRFLIWGCTIAAVLIVLGGVLGGVLGSRRNSTRDETSDNSANSTTPTSISPSTSTSPSDSSSTSSMASLTQIKQESALAVGGIRKSAGVEIYLYYQSSDSHLRTSMYNSSEATTTTNGSYWGESEEIVLYTGNSSVAVGLVAWGTIYEVSIATGRLPQCPLPSQSSRKFLSFKTPARQQF